MTTTTRALLSLLLLGGLACEPTKSIELVLPEAIERDDVLLEVAVYVAATPNITCEALELGVINAAQLLPARVLVAGVEQTARVGSVPRDERRLVVANAFSAATAALVAKGCIELEARQSGGVVLPLLQTVEASFAVDVTVTARVDGDDIDYELYDDDLELTAVQSIILNMENELSPGVFIDAPVRLTVTRDEELIREVVLEQTAGRINTAEIGVDGPGFYRVELRPRWSAAPLAFDVGAFVIEPLNIAGLDDTLGAELTQVGGKPAVITRAGDVVTFSPLDGAAPINVTVDGALPYVGHVPNRGALFAQLGVGLFFAPHAGALQLLPSLGNGNYQYPVLPTAGCPDGDRFVIVRNGALFSFLDRVDLDAGTVTLDAGGGGLPITLGPSACIRAEGGGETRVGVTQTNAFGLLVPTVASGERFEDGQLFADIVLLTPTTLSLTLALGRDGDGAVLLATPDFDGVSVSAYLVNLEEQLLVRQREALLVPAAPVALAGGDADGPLDVALSHLEGVRARLDIGRGGARAVLPITCDAQLQTAVTSAPPCQLRVIDVDDDGLDEIVVLRSVGGSVSIDVISLDR